MKPITTGLLLAFFISTQFQSAFAQKRKAVDFQPFAHAGDSITYYMQTAEVSNKQYRKFLQSISSEDSAKYAVKSEGWSLLFKQEMEVYFTDEAYDDFPVVNVSKVGAMAYCAWLDSLSGNPNTLHSLPSVAQWKDAARANQHQTYPWESELLEDHEGRKYANYRWTFQECITASPQGSPMYVPDCVNSEGYANKDITATVGSYWPNANGLYNMSGNVAEMVSDADYVVGGSWADFGYDVRIDSYQAYEGPAPTVGFRVMKSVKTLELIVRK